MDFSAISEYVRLKDEGGEDLSYLRDPTLPPSSRGVAAAAARGSSPEEERFELPTLPQPSAAPSEREPFGGRPPCPSSPVPNPSITPNPSEPRIRSVAAGNLMVKDFETLRMPVEGLIVEGLTLLCGASKIGKSWLVLQLCCAVATGEDFLGLRTQQGSVLYLALEDSERRLQLRLRQLGEDASRLTHLHLATRCSTLGEGLLEELEEQFTRIGDLSMIVIDTLQKVRGCVGGNQNAYTADYATMSSLKSFADRHHVALVLVHHLNKMKDAADPYDRINGSNALMGAADTTMLLSRQRNSDDASVTFTGRDVWGEDLLLHRDGVRWSAVSKQAREREAYLHDPIVITCRELLDESLTASTVKISSDDFRATALQRRGAHVADTNAVLIQRLRELTPLLEKYDGIQLFFDKRINGQRGFWIGRAQA